MNFSNSWSINHEDVVVGEHYIAEVLDNRIFPGSISSNRNFGHCRSREMLLSIAHTTFTSPSLSTHFKAGSFGSSTPLPKSLFPAFDTQPAGTLQRFLGWSRRRRDSNSGKFRSVIDVRASLIEAPILWVGRVCIFYALLKAGLAGSQSNPLLSDLGAGVDDGDGGSTDLGFSKWLESIQGKPVDEAADRRKLVSKWHPTTKGTLRRNYRVPSKSEGRRLLKSIATLLSDDDNFIDATSHKGCQIRRESAHGESVCCNNVRALFDELPTPHLIVEITPFPAGPLADKDYTKAEKLERVLRSGPSV